MINESVSERNSAPLELEQDMHNWFGLTYAQFLVIPRVVMEAMPREWQGRMAELLDQLDDAFDYLPPDDKSYFVRVGRAVEWPYEDDDGNPLEPTLEEPPEDLCNYRRPSIEYRRKKAGAP